MWLFVLYVTLLMSDVTFPEECQSVCGKNNAIPISATKRIRCSMEYREHTPYSRIGQVTAPMAQNIWSAWYLTRERSIALVVKWSQKVNHLTSGTVQGYYLHYLMNLHDDAYTFHSTVRTVLNVTTEEDANFTKDAFSEDVVHFEFPCIGQTGSLWLRPRDRVRIRLHSLPMYRRHNNPQFMETIVTIPSCEEDERLADLELPEMAECQAYWKGFHEAWTINQTSEMNLTGRTTILVHQRYPDHTIYFVLAGAIATFLIIPILLCMVQRSHHISRGHNSIAMITSESSFDIVKAHRLVTKLRDVYNLDITVNWENQEEIRKSGCRWYQELMNQSTIVIFIVERWNYSEDMEEFNVSSEMKQALQCANCHSIASDTDIAILTLKNNQRKHQTKFLIYEADRDFFRLLRKVTGKHIRKDVTMNKFLALETQSTNTLSNCQYGTDHIDAIHQRETLLQNNSQQTEYNNL